MKESGSPKFILCISEKYVYMPGILYPVICLPEPEVADYSVDNPPQF